MEQTREHGWAVTGATLQFDLVEVGKTIVEGVCVRPQSLAPYSERKVLLLVDRPFTPVTVRSSPEMHLSVAGVVRLMHGPTVLHSGGGNRLRLEGRCGA